MESNYWDCKAETVIMKKLRTIIFPFNDLSELIVTVAIVALSYALTDDKQSWFFSMGISYAVVVLMYASGVQSLYRFERWRFVRNK